MKFLNKLILLLLVLAFSSFSLPGEHLSVPSKSEISKLKIETSLEVKVHNNEITVKSRPVDSLFLFITSLEFLTREPLRGGGDFLLSSLSYCFMRLGVLRSQSHPPTL